MDFYSQLGQDKFLFENYFKDKESGFFVEIGAYDGKKFSNTLFFETYLDWKGICIEPLPSAYRALTSNRTSICLNCCISDYDGKGDFLDVDVQIDEKMLSGLVENYHEIHTKRIADRLLSKNTIDVQVRTINSILQEHQIKKIDYCSIDTEGSELKILKSIDFTKFSISFFSIENNYNDREIRDFMSGKGYELVHTFHGYDELYKKVGISKIPTVTIICAVWHGDPNRFSLLQGHMANLDAQSCEVERVYIFDNSDIPPDGLKGSILVSRGKLSIYEAWNTALTMVRTPYVMNLNLDDRLAPDAVAFLEQAMNEGADIVGGEWKVCFSQSETDAVEACRSATLLPFLPNWPPVFDNTTRLGSGTGDRGTYGPACMWAMSLHEEFTRYPWQFGDYTLIKTIGDAVWWHLLQERNKTLVRCPVVIGNYHSHPSSQAEFRGLAVVEEEHLFKVGVTLV